MIIFYLNSIIYYFIELINFSDNFNLKKYKISKFAIKYVMPIIIQFVWVWWYYVWYIINCEFI